MGKKKSSAIRILDPDIPRRHNSMANASFDGFFHPKTRCRFRGPRAGIQGKRGFSYYGGERMHLILENECLWAPANIVSAIVGKSQVSCDKENEFKNRYFRIDGLYIGIPIEIAKDLDRFLTPDKALGVITRLKWEIIENNVSRMLTE